MALGMRIERIEKHVCSACAYFQVSSLASAFNLLVLMLMLKTLELLKLVIQF